MGANLAEASGGKLSSKLSLPPLAQTSSYATAVRCQEFFVTLKLLLRKKLVVLATYLPFLLGFGNGTGTSYYCTFYYFALTMI